MKTIPLLLATLQVSIILLSSTFARAEDSDTNPCDLALASTKRFLQEKTTIRSHLLELSNQYQGYPSDRFLGHTIILNAEESSSKRLGPTSPAWDKAASIMKSPRLQQSVATQVIRACPTIGSVTFWLDTPGSSQWDKVFGIMPDGTITEFQCVDDPRRTSNSLDWGFSYCI